MDSIFHHLAPVYHALMDAHYVARRPNVRHVSPIIISIMDYALQHVQRIITYQRASVHHVQWA
jgi:hypothetical protein